MDKARVFVKGEILLEAKKRKGYKFREIGRITGVSGSAISAIMHDDKTHDVESVIAIAKCLDVDPQTVIEEMTDDKRMIIELSKKVRTLTKSNNASARRERELERENSSLREKFKDGKNGDYIINLDTANLFHSSDRERMQKLKFKNDELEKLHAKDIKIVKNLEYINSKQKLTIGNLKVRIDSQDRAIDRLTNDVRQKDNIISNCKDTIAELEERLHAKDEALRREDNLVRQLNEYINELKRQK